MSLANEDLIANEKSENDYRAFQDALKEIDDVDRCLLFSAARDFSEACSCDECLHKITKLKDFEKEIKYKKHLILNHRDKINRDEDLCTSLSSTARWSKITLDMLLRHLKEVYEKSEVPFNLKKVPSADKIRDVDDNLVQILKSNNLLDDVDDDDDDEPDDPFYFHPIRIQIRFGLYHYTLTKVRDKAFGLLEQILRLEEEHEIFKRDAQERGEVPDHSISKKFIEDQIMLVKKLPVEGLIEQAIELIPKALSAPDERKKVNEFLSLVRRTCWATIRERNDFWRRYHESSSSASKGESKGCHSNGLHLTLDSLLEKVCAFNKQWEQECAHILTPSEQSAPKRQQTD